MMEKDALLGEIVRGLLTDIPGTPRGFIREHSPQELAAIQHSINSLGGLKYRAEDAVHGLADRVFTPRVSGAVKSIASMGIRNPEIIPMQALPIPGLTPAYLAGKRGLEKGIERIAPVFKGKAAMDAGLMGSLQSAAGAGAKLRLKKGIGQFAGKTFNDQARKVTLAPVADPFKAAFAVSQYSGPLNPSIPSQASSAPGFLAPNLQSAVQKRKQAAGAPTRGNFYMSSDIPSFNPPDLKSVIQKRSEFDGKNQPNEGEQKMADGNNRQSGLDEPNQPVNKVGGFKLEGDAVIETDKNGKSLGKGDLLEKKTSFMGAALEKDSDMLPDYVTYNQSDFKRSKYAMSLEGMSTFVAQLRKVAASGNSIMGVSPTLGGASSVAKAVGAPKLSGPGPSIAQQVKPKGPHFGTGIAGAFKGSIGGRAPQDLS